MKKTLKMSMMKSQIAALKNQAKQGDAEAQYRLGVMYYKGENVPQNDAKAVKWYEQAANQEHVKAQVELGFMYARKRSEIQDYAKTLYWTEKAAAHGDANAQFNLGLMYDYGWGVPQDFAKARHYWEQAAAQGHQEAREVLQELNENTTHGLPPHEEDRVDGVLTHN